MPNIDREITVIHSAYPCTYRFMSIVIDVETPIAFCLLFELLLLLALFTRPSNNPLLTL